ncbi:MAG TPA: cytochrome c oxidase subunit II [Thermomicrobiales bacterium]|nr:cytochrome c oxidase subunit II [Thermomicrobiales bacterium]
MDRRFPGRWPGGFRSGRLFRILAVVTLLLLAFTLSACSVTSDPQSTIARDGRANDRIWFVYDILWIGVAVVLILVEGLLIYTLIRFRRRPKTVHGRPVPVHGNTTLEIAWTIIPAVILVAISIPTLQVLADLSDPPDDQPQMQIDVIGHQFYFEFQYPEEGLQTTNTLHIPEDTIVDIDITSGDVIHSLWVPRLNGKTDAVPGRTNDMWIEADNPGTYHGQCAEFCGTGHALMRFTVEVHTKADYDAWVQQQKDRAAGGGELAQRGQQIAQENGCTGCHSIDGSAAVGPTWQGLFGHEVTLSDGSTVTADEAYITESIRDPSAKIVQGFPDIMPKTFADMSQDDIDAIIAYIQTLTE